MSHLSKIRMFFFGLYNSQHCWKLYKIIKIWKSSKLLQSQLVPTPCQFRLITATMVFTPFKVDAMLFTCVNMESEIRCKFALMVCFTMRMENIVTGLKTLLVFIWIKRRNIFNSEWLRYQQSIKQTNFEFEYELCLSYCHPLLFRPYSTK